MDKLQKIILYLFCALFFLTPLILWPTTSEVFEFNKMVFVYVMTTLIVSAWLTRSVLVKKFIFRRTLLDIPLLIFLSSQIISTIFSIDVVTSIFGYYSRFNGGLLSSVCYSLLYWAFVSNLDRKSALRTMYSVLISAVIVSIYGILEHFGIDKTIWVQDVQSRVFSTLGQPNWLAAWLVALIPLTWALMLKSKVKSQNLILHILSAVFFVVLLFTGSRSGLLGFATAFVIFWSLAFWKYRKQILKPFLVISSSLLVISLIIGTQYTPSIQSLLSNQVTKNKASVPQGTALETGGTESGAIRKIVWTGAIQVWLHNPIIGTGVETFAYSYYKYRPVEHNLTSEWDFVYNKAHNEFLNIAANSGTVGLLAYLILIGFSIFQISKVNNPLTFALLSSYVSLLITNFFGFSVVPIQLEFFLFPAIAFTIAKGKEGKVKSKITFISNGRKIAIRTLLLFTFYLLLCTANYWRADYLYATGKSYNSIKRPDVATKYLSQAIAITPFQAIYHAEIASSYASLANSKQIAYLAISEIEEAVALSPANINLKRMEYSVFMNLLEINQNYLINARDALIAATTQAPTDAKLHYFLGLTYAKNGQGILSLEALQKAIDLKSDYKEARDAYDIIRP